MEGPARGECRALLAAAVRAAEPLVAPHLLWSETSSALHEALWRGESQRATAEDGLQLIADLPIEPQSPPGLRARAWQIAERMGWAKTYDAEYCGLAELVGCRLVTRDERLLRGARGRLPYVVSVAQAAASLRSS